MNTKAQQVREEEVTIGDSELPEGWTETTLDQLLVRLESGSRPQGGVRGIASGIPSIGGEHISDTGGFQFESLKFVPQPFYDRMRRGHIVGGDVLIVKDGATTGKVALVKSDFPFTIAVANEHVFVCRAAHEVHSPFLFYYLFSEEGQQRILNNFRGSAQGGINQGFACGTSIRLAPLREQERIVQQLSNGTPKLTAVHARLDKVARTLKYFRQAVLAAACSGKLTEDWRDSHPLPSFDDDSRGILDADESSLLTDLPDSWRWTTLGECATVQRGRFSVRPRNHPAYYGGPYPFVQIGDLPPGGGEISKFNQSLNGRGLAVSKLFPRGTVLIAIVGATIGNTGVLGFDSCCPDSLVAVRGQSDEHSRFLEYYLRLRKLRIRNESYASGGQPNINLQTLLPYPAPLPPPEEVSAIVQKAEKLFDLAVAIENRVAAASLRAEKLTQAILAKAFRGELVSTEAELARREGRDYEPASVLLERIKVERAKTISVRPQKCKARAARQSAS